MGSPAVAEIGPLGWIGPYRLVRHLGSGGMGTVYLARQDEPVERTVALKVIQLRRDTDPASDYRFASEQQALALLSHPNVAQLYDVGRVEDGQAFFAMEYVRGKTVTRFCEDRELPLRERLEIFVKICRGVEHAHQKGVLHRDIKPANVLVTEVDREFVPKLIDFGIAKGLERPLADVTALTDDGVVGTLAYLSPEAIDGEAERSRLDTRSDVYALGILLHELLVGHRPFESSRESTVQILRRILDADLPLPSQHVRSLTAEQRAEAALARRVSDRRLAESLEGDLDGITARATARKPEQRYASAGELAADVLRYLADQPVLASPPGTVGRLRKWVRRNRLVFAASCAVALALLLGAAAATVGMLRARSEARVARAAQGESDQVVEFVSDLFLAANPNEGRPMDERVGDVLSRGAERLREELKDEPRVRSRLLLTIGGIFRRSGELEDSAELLREALQVRRQSSSDALEIAEAAQNLATTHLDLSQHAPAQQLLEEAIAIRERALGANHPLTLESRLSLGSALVVEGRLQDALDLQLETLDRMETAYGSESEKVGHALAEIGGLQIRLLDTAGARQTYERAIRIFRARVGERHPMIGLLLVNRAAIDGTLDGPESEEMTLREALAVFDDSLEPNHPWVLAARYGLAGILRTRGRFEEAELLFADLVPAFRDSSGDEHLLTLQTEFTWGETLTEVGRGEEGLGVMRRTLERHRRLYPEQYREAADRASRLGRALCDLGHLEEAATVIAAARGDLAERGESRSFDAASLASSAACVQMARFHPARARQELQLALKIRRGLEEGANAGNALLLSRIGDTYESEGDVVGAHHWFEQAVSEFDELTWLDWESDQRLVEIRSQLARVAGWDSDGTAE